MEAPAVSLDELLQRGYRYAMSLTHDSTRAEDLLQDSWTAVLQAGGAQTIGYLFSSIRSRFINQCRRERLVPMMQLDEATERGLLDSGENRNDDLVRANYESLEKALSQLRPVEREALFLAVVEGYTAQEIANLTQQGRGTVLSLIHRAKAKMRRFLHQAQVRAHR
ncbi:MAG TPA: RNA polymerase sigma factor [Candidatus Binatia bacterium]|nr:RNA polymerase sigma factor [Candidatus Binatia bacterium]